MPVTGCVVSYNREIHNRVDDSVIRIINHNTSIIRRSRGFVPQPVDLISDAEGIFAAGAEQKNSFCIGKGSQAFMSQYIGDIKNVATYDFYHGDLQAVLFSLQVHSLISCVRYASGLPVGKVCRITGRRKQDFR